MLHGDAFAELLLLGRLIRVVLGSLLEDRCDEAVVPACE